MIDFIFRQRVWRWWLMAGLVAWPAVGWAQGGAKSRFQAGPTNPFVMGVAGEGRVAPAGGLLRLSAPPGAQGAAMVSQLLVATGDWVESGQLLAVLNTRPILLAQAEAATQQVAVAQAALEQAKAAATQADIESAAQLGILESRALAAKATAHLAAVNSALALEQAKREAAAAQAALDAAKAGQPLLVAIGNATVAVAQAQYDDIPRMSNGSRRIAMAGIEQAKTGAVKANADMANQIEQLQAQADLAVLKVKQAATSLVVEPADGAQPEDPALLAPVQLEERTAHANFKAEEVTREQEMAARAADVAAAQARLAAAQADAAAAQAQVALSEIHAPYAGRILGIHARPGEVVGPAGVFDFGDTREMYVDVEVAYDDVAGAHVGQKAMITSDALGDSYTGQVVEIAAMVGNNQLQSIDPTAFTDQRVVMVKVHLDKPEVFAKLVNGQVTVRLEP